MTNSCEGFMDRRHFLKLTGGSAAAMLLSEGCLSVAAGEAAPPGARPRPNLLWISCEDTGCELGCYGDAYARTPYLDELASQGVRYTNAFANAGVCAPARSCIITGMYPTTIGTHQMRCKGVPPVYVKAFSEYLRAAGYYCTNNQKTDYQFDSPPSAWDECHGEAHYANRGPGQPFFAVFNITISHESKIRDREKWMMDRLARIKRHDPAKAPVPPYHPDTPVARRDWAQYYDIVTLMDTEAGEILKKLEKDGLAEDTIIWFWGDHGAGMPRSKRWVYDSGIHVPLIIRVPEKYQKLVMPDNPAGPKPGGTCEQLVSFVDFAPTMLSLADVKIPEYMQGKAFLGEQKNEARQYIFAHRDRMDERYDIIRAVRDKRYKYIRNYMPYVTRGQYIEYMDQMPTMGEMRRLYAAGELKGAQLQYFEPTKPIEELYDISRDPHEVNNLADDPHYSDVLQRMRRTHDDWMKETGDVGLIPEPEFDEMKRPGGKWEKTDKPVFMSTPGKKGHITIACATAGASLLYRTEGSKQWKLYTNPVKLETPDKIEAKACRIGFEDSDVASFKSGDAFGTPAEKELRPHWRETLANSDLLERLWEIKQLDYSFGYAQDRKGKAAKRQYLRSLDEKNASARYWAVVGLHWRSGTAEEIERAKTAIGRLLDDRSPAVRVAAAEALCNWGQQNKALPVLVELLRDRSGSVRLLAANALGAIGEKAKPASADIKSSLDDSNGDVVKVTRRTLELLKARSE